MSASVKVLPALLAEDIETILTNAADLTCTVDVVQYTAGEPATPVGTCPTVSVWVSELFNIGDQPPLTRQSDELACVARPAATLKTRVDVCYTETDQGDITPTDHATVADCLHGLVAAIWCGLADLWNRSELMGTYGCHDSTIGDFQTGERSGGIVTATLDIQAELDCTGATS